MSSEFNKICEQELYQLYLAEKSPTKRREYVEGIYLASLLVYIACNDDNTDVALLAVSHIKAEEMLKEVRNRVNNIFVRQEVSRRLGETLTKDVEN